MNKKEGLNSWTIQQIKDKIHILTEEITTLCHSQNFSSIDKQMKKIEQTKKDRQEWVDYLKERVSNGSKSKEVKK